MVVYFSKSDIKRTHGECKILKSVKFAPLRRRVGVKLPTALHGFPPKFLGQMIKYFVVIFAIKLYPATKRFQVTDPRPRPPPPNHTPIPQPIGREQNAGGKKHARTKPTKLLSNPVIFQTIDFTLVEIIAASVLGFFPRQTFHAYTDIAHKRGPYITYNIDVYV